MQGENTDGKQSLLNNVRMHDQCHTLAQKVACYLAIICIYRCMCYMHICDIWNNITLLWSIQEREVDTPDGLGCSLTATAQYVYNAIHDEAEAKVSLWRDAHACT